MVVQPPAPRTDRPVVQQRKHQNLSQRLHRVRVDLPRVAVREQPLPGHPDRREQEHVGELEVLEGEGRLAVRGEMAAELDVGFDPDAVVFEVLAGGYFLGDPADDLYGDHGVQAGDGFVEVRFLKYGFFRIWHSRPSISSFTASMEAIPGASEEESTMCRANDGLRRSSAVS